MKIAAITQHNQKSKLYHHRVTEDPCGDELVGESVNLGMFGILTRTHVGSPVLQKMEFGHARNPSLPNLSWIRKPESFALTTSVPCQMGIVNLELMENSTALQRLSGQRSDQLASRVKFRVKVAIIILEELFCSVAGGNHWLVFALSL